MVSITPNSAKNEFITNETDPPKKTIESPLLAELIEKLSGNPSSFNLLTKREKIEKLSPELSKEFKIFCTALPNSKKLLALSGKLNPVNQELQNEIPLVDKLYTAFTEKNRERLNEIFSLFLENPLLFLETKEDQISGLKNRYNHLNRFNFFECGCKNYDRTATDWRWKAEEIIISGIDLTHPNKNERLKLTILGYGGLLQDLILIGKLFQKGFTDIAIHFIEIEVMNLELISIFQKLLTEIYPVDLTYVVGVNPLFFDMDAVIAIDFDLLYQADGRCWELFFQAQASLNDNGKMYVFSKNNFITNKFHQIYDPFLSKKIYKTISQSADFFKKKNLEEIKITIIKDDSRLNFDIPYIAQLAQFLTLTYKKNLHLKLYKSRLRLQPDYILPKNLILEILKNVTNIEHLRVEYFNRIPNEDDLKNSDLFIRQGSKDNPNHFEFKILQSQNDNLGNMTLPSRQMNPFLFLKEGF